MLVQEISHRQPQAGDNARQRRAYTDVQQRIASGRPERHRCLNVFLRYRVQSSHDGHDHDGNNPDPDQQKLWQLTDAEPHNQQWDKRQRRQRPAKLDQRVNDQPQRPHRRHGRSQHHSRDRPPGKSGKNAHQTRRGVPEQRVPAGGIGRTQVMDQRESRISRRRQDHVVRDNERHNPPDDNNAHNTDQAHPHPSPIDRRETPKKRRSRCFDTACRQRLFRPCSGRKLLKSA